MRSYAVLPLEINNNDDKTGKIKCSKAPRRLKAGRGAQED